MTDFFRFSRAAATMLHCGVAYSALLLGTAALAQVPETPSTPQDPNKEPQTETVDQQAAGGIANISSEEPVQDDEIVITGTLLRGAPPVGSNLIAVGQERIQSSGATTSNELLATVPQVNNLFNNVPSSRLSVAVNQIQVVRPNLRNLAPETGSASSTLVLFDGHRIAGVGVTQSSVDPDLIPTGAIERVEVVTDGGSATYGADAVGGVINFITRKRFDGVKIDGRYGFADDYYQVDGSVTAGKDWGSGSLFASYTYQHNDAIFGRDRDFIRQVNWNDPALTPTGRQCNPGNVILGGVTYALPNLTANTFNACDASDDMSFVPKSTRHGAIAALHQDFSDAISVDLRAFYGERRSISLSPFRGAANVRAAQAFYRPIATNPTATQSVQFTFAPVLGDNPARSISAFKEWGANAEFTVELNDKWQVRQLFNYSRSNSEFSIEGLNTTLINSAGASADPATAINFYDPAVTPNLDLIRAAANNHIQAGQGKDTLFNVRTILDGTLFELPGGEVKLAVGYEFYREGFKQRVATNIVPGALSAVPFGSYNRRVHSVFGEIQVPIVGEGNRMGGIYSLTLAGSARYDHFSDFGSTTNPKIGVTYKPVRWLGLRGNYSTSFNAPTPVDQLASRANFFQVFPLLAVVPPGTTAPPFGTVQTIVLMGAASNLQPQTAKTYSFGIDIDPPFLSGLHASLNYYNVKFNGVLNRPPAQSPDILFSAFSDLVTLNPSDAFLQSLIPLASNGAVTINTALQSPVPVIQFIDFRLNNFGNLKLDGLDFVANYRMSTGFGGLDASVSGNYQLNRKTQIRAGLPFTDLLAPGSNTSRLQLQATLGADIGNFRAQATLNHSSGFKVLRGATLPQDRVSDFNTVNLFFRYDLPGESLLLKGLSVTLNVNNVFDEDPPLFKQTAGSTINGYTNGFTLGRLVQFGVSKKF